jgi:hypothetical protein
MSRYTRQLLILAAIVVISMLPWRYGFGGGTPIGSN